MPLQLDCLSSTAPAPGRVQIAQRLQALKIKRKEKKIISPPLNKKNKTERRERSGITLKLNLFFGLFFLFSPLSDWFPYFKQQLHGIVFKVLEVRKEKKLKGLV